MHRQKELIDAAKHVLQRLIQHGHTTYFAGGWVRDLLLGLDSDDIDIVTAASVEQIEQIFPKTIPVGIAFGIVIVVHGTFHFEVATFRKEGLYLDGRRPSLVETATPEEDALRRDFTINGMFYDPIKNTLLDFVQGQEDLKKRVVRAIGDPVQRFTEDKLRMIRAVRYCTRFGFTLEQKTKEAIKLFAHTLFPSVATERVWQEMMKIAEHGQIKASLQLLYELGLLIIIFPHIERLHPAQFLLIIKGLEKFPKETPLVFQIVQLYPQDMLDQAALLGDRFHLSTTQKNQINFYIHSKKLLDSSLAEGENISLHDWAHFYAHQDAGVVLTLFAAYLSSPLAERFKKVHAERQMRLACSICRIQESRPVITAQHLIQEGVPPGKTLGLLLKEAHKIEINSQIEDPQKIINLLKKHSNWI